MSFFKGFFWFTFGNPVWLIGFILFVNYVWRQS